MATVDAMTYFWRLHKLRVEFENVTPVWENVGGTYAFGLANWYISLHTADPFAVSEVNTQNTSEASFAGYARVAVARSGAQWTPNSSDPANPFTSNTNGIVFGKNTSGASVTITHIGIGTDAAGAGYLTRRIPLDSSVVIPNNGTFAIAALALKIWER